jgi:hypothetical protein
MERREAPREPALRAPFRPTLRSASLRAKLPGPNWLLRANALRAVGVPGRAGPCEEPGASRRSIAARVVGGRILLRSSGAAIDGTSDEAG